MFESLETKLCYTFRDKELLSLALTHISLHGVLHYERLEFLGDAILSYVISDALYELSDCTEGVLSKIRASLVNQSVLVEIALKLGLDNHIKFGSGQKSSSRKHAIFADCVEAIIAAVYLDSSINEAVKFVRKIYAPYLDKVTASKAPLMQDYKSSLQEYLQSQTLPCPVYTVVDTQGPDHDLTFVVACKIDAFDLDVTGTGNTKKQASQHAARRALLELSLIS